MQDFLSDEKLARADLMGGFINNQQDHTTVAQESLTKACLLGPLLTHHIGFVGQSECNTVLCAVITVKEQGADETKIK